MKKKLMLPILTMFLAGCSLESTKTEKNENPPLTPTPITVMQAEEPEPVNPISAIFGENIVVLSDPGEIYPKRTQILIDSIDDSHLKAIIVQDGLPDDVLRRQDYELFIEKQEDGGWKTTSKKLIKEECRPNRSCK